MAEAKGEPRPETPTVSLDVPGDAHLPDDYVPGEDTRLEAYRRLAATTTAEGVDDVADEWLDRFGPPPPAAAGLLDLARLRAECLRTGVTEVSVVPARPGGLLEARAKLTPVTLGTTAQVRLRRLAPEARYREELSQLLVPLSGREPPAVELRDLLRGLFPVEAATAPAGDAGPPAAAPAEAAGPVEAAGAGARTATRRSGAARAGR